MTPDEGQGRAEALFSACVNAVDKHGVVDEVGMREAINTITAALRAERVKGMEVVKAALQSHKSNWRWEHEGWRDEAIEVVDQALREQARRAGEAKG